MTENSWGYCLKHPDIETGLSCGKCGDPICARCLVHTSVGARCSNCVQTYKSVTYEITGSLLYKAVGTAIVVSVTGGVVLGLLARSGIGGNLFLSALLFAVLGYAVGEVVSLAANRRRGRVLQVIVFLGITLAIVTTVLISDVFILWWIFGILGAFVAGLNRVR